MKITKLFFLFIIVFSSVSCKKDDDVSAELHSPVSIVGVWYPRSFQVFDSQTNNPEIEVSAYSVCKQKNSKQFNENKTVTQKQYQETFSSCIDDGVATYKYELNGSDQIIFTFYNNTAVLYNKIVSMTDSQLILRNDFVSDSSGVPKNVYQITTYTK